MILKKTLVAIALLCAALNCSKHEEIPTPVLLPLQEGSQIKYASYLTDSMRQIQHQLEYIPRYYVRSDSSTAGKRHYYVEKNRLCSYRVDTKGGLDAEIQLDLSAYAAAAGFLYKEPILFSYWRPLFRKEEGFGTRWSARADTEYALADEKGVLHTLTFGHRGSARLEGWTEITVPASKEEKLKVLNVHWLEFTNYLLDRNSGDTLWVQRGESRELFEPRIGLARTMSNFTTRKKGESPIYRQSTMDLYLMIIPSK